MRIVKNHCGNFIGKRFIGRGHRGPRVKVLGVSMCGLGDDPCSDCMTNGICLVTDHTVPYDRICVGVGDKEILGEENLESS